MNRRGRKVTSLARMQRLFAMFPTAGPGIGLLLLRVAVAMPLAAGAAPIAALPWLPIAVACGLAVGVATPVFAALAVALHLVRAAGAAPLGAPVLTAVLAAIALALLGPGAYSIDARLYGRRRVVTLASRG